MNNVNTSDWGEANEGDVFVEQASEISDHLSMQYECYNLHAIAIDVAPDYGTFISIPSNISMNCAMEGDCILWEAENLNYICISRTVDIYSFVDKKYPGDGVMPAYSARSFPGAQQSIEMLGSNHQQLRNDKNTKEAFLKMYSGDYGLKFKQTPR